ncbi:flippase [Chloroflexota bacterium]
MQQSYRRFTKDVIIIGLTNFLQFIVGIIQLPLFTKTLGVHSYGTWIQVNATRSLIAPFTGLGLGGAMVRFLAAEKNREEIREQFYSVIAVSLGANLLASLILLALAYPLATNFFSGATQIVRLTAILLLLTPVSSLHLEFFRAFQQMRKYSFFIITEQCSRIGVFTFLAINGYGIFSIVVSAVLIQTVILLILIFVVKSQIGFQIPSFRYLKKYLSFGLPLIPRSISYWLIHLSDRYIISYFMGVGAVGVYSAAYGIGSVPYTVCAVLTLTLMAPLSRYYDEGRTDEVQTHLRYSLKYFLTVMIPFVFGATILAKPVLNIFSTTGIANEAHILVPILASGILFLSIHNLISFILILNKKPKILAVIWVVAAVLNLGLNIVMVPRVGILGAAISTLISYSLVLILVSYYSFREFNLFIDWIFIIKSLIASAVMSVAVWFIAPEGTADTILTIMAGVAIYGVVLVLLRGFKKEEVSFFWGMLRRATPSVEPGDSPVK